MTSATEFSPSLRRALSATELTRDALASRAEAARTDLAARTYHSWKMALDRAEAISDVAGAAGAPGLDLFLSGGQGGMVTDLDGNAMVDLCMGHGAQLLGHGHPVIAQALNRQIGAGWQLGLPTEAQLALAHLIRAAVPSNERVAFTANGSDATLLAMRAARAITGRDGIAVFTGSFHGAHDYGMVSGAPDPADLQSLSRKIHLSAGVPRAVDHVMTVLPYGHPRAFDIIRRQRNDLAAVIVEAVRGSEPHLDAGPWLKELSAACRLAGVLLILDEVTTGFRLAYGGAQELFGLTPDLVAYGKAIGGGLPLGAIAGRSDYMGVFGSDPGQRTIFAASTFAGNPLSIAAGVATLTYAHGNRASLYPALDAVAARLQEGFASLAEEAAVPACLLRAGSLMRVRLGTPNGRSSAYVAAVRRAEDTFATHVLNAGVLMQAGLRGFVGAAHDDTHIARALKAFAIALREVKADGLFTPLTAN